MDPNTPPQLSREFDPDLWKSGVEDGAFAGDRDPDSIWYILKVGKDKVALASAVPGPGDLTTISYFVHPDYREKGYGTKIASQVTDLHDKATFTIFRDNEASVKVAIAALKEKFSMTMGHNVVRLTKEAGEKKAIDPLLLAAFGAAGLAGGALGAKLGQKIRAALMKRKLKVPKEAVHLMDPEDIASLKEKVEGFEVSVKVSREMLKHAVSMRRVMRATRSANIARTGGGGMPSTYRVEQVSKSTKRLPAAEMTKGERKAAKGMIRGEQAFPRDKKLSMAISRRVRASEGSQELLRI